MFTEIQNNGRNSEAAENLQQETEPYIQIESVKTAEQKEIQNDVYSIVDPPLAVKRKKPEFEVEL